MFLFKVILPKIEKLETGDSKSDNMSKKGQKQRYPITKHPTLLGFLNSAKIILSLKSMCCRNHFLYTSYIVICADPVLVLPTIYQACL